MAGSHDTSAHDPADRNSHSANRFLAIGLRTTLKLKTMPPKSTTPSGSESGDRVVPLDFLPKIGVDGERQHFGHERLGFTRWILPTYVAVDDPVLHDPNATEAMKRRKRNDIEHNKRLIHAVRLQDRVAVQVRKWVEQDQLTLRGAATRGRMDHSTLLKLLSGHELMTADRLATIVRCFVPRVLELQHPPEELIWEEPEESQIRALEVGSVTREQFMAEVKAISDAANERADRLQYPRVRNQISQMTDPRRGANPVMGFRTRQNSRMRVFLAGDLYDVRNHLGSAYAPSGRFVLGAYRYGPLGKAELVQVLDLFPMSGQEEAEWGVSIEPSGIEDDA